MPITALLSRLLLILALVATGVGPLAAASHEGGPARGDTVHAMAANDAPGDCHGGGDVMADADRQEPAVPHGGDCCDGEGGACDGVCLGGVPALPVSAPAAAPPVADAHPAARITAPCGAPVSSPPMRPPIA